jgi:hypothetical protein
MPLPHSNKWIRLATEFFLARFDQMRHSFTVLFAGKTAVPVATKIAKFL